MIAPNSQHGTDGRHALEGALDAVPVGVVLFDPEGKPLVTSRAARELLGDLVTRRLVRWPESGVFLDTSGGTILAADFPPLQTLRDGTSRTEVEVGIENVDGTVTPVMLCCRGVKDPDGEVVQVALSITPLANQSQRRTKERMAERFDSIGALTASVAGPLNDALTAIAGYCELARTNLQDGDPVQAVISEIRQAGQRATVLTGRLLAHGRQEVPVPRVLDLDKWLATRVTALNALLGNDIRLELQPSAEGQLVLIDARLLEQALADVLANAREAMPDGGCVRISTALAENDMALLGEGEVAERTVVMAVTDTGGGIADPVLRRIFEPFFTTKPGALGLGLATVERLMRLQGGQVRVQNQRGTGLSVQLHLKPAPSTATVAPDWERPERSAKRGPRVLVVEDDEFVRELEVEVLQRERFHVIEARSPADAFRILEKESDAPDLLISDLAMPGETGGSLAAKLQERFPDMLVLFVSGASDPTALAGSFESGRTAFLAKPFAPEALVTRVGALLRDRIQKAEPSPEPVELLEPAEPEAPVPVESTGTLEEEPIRVGAVEQDPADEPSGVDVPVPEDRPAFETPTADPLSNLDPLEPVAEGRPAPPIEHRPLPPRGPVSLRPTA